MLTILYRYLLIFIAALSILLGLLGVFLPVLPTTPFFILALACLARSSPAFQQKLLTFPYIGESLRDWEKEKKIAKKRKVQIYLTIIASFTISIVLLRERYLLQLLLIIIMLILLLFIRRIAEK
ncbi:MAG TPA: YbaN family protein [Psychromonas sp.]